MCHFFVKLTYDKVTRRSNFLVHLLHWNHSNPSRTWQWNGAGVTILAGRPAGKISLCQEFAIVFVFCALASLKTKGPLNKALPCCCLILLCNIMHSITLLRNRGVVLILPSNVTSITYTHITLPSLCHHFACKMKKWTGWSDDNLQQRN